MVVSSSLPLRVPVLLADGAQAPEYASDGASGLDLRAMTWRRHDDGVDVRRVAGIDLDPGERVHCYTGVRLALPPGFEGQVRPRSGLALRVGVTCHLGTIDHDYRGEVGVVLVNLGDTRVTLAPRERVAQLVVAPVVRVRLEPVGELDDTPRGEGGFGSTGRA